MALAASTFGGLVSALCLLFFAPQISKIAIHFGAPEYFALAVFGLSVIASVSGRSILKGVISGAFGVLIATVGIDAVSGVTRFTFGSLQMYNGIKMLAVLLGVYAIAQMISRVNGTEEEEAGTELKKADPSDRLTLGELKSTVPTMLKSSAIGAFIGAIPGTGGAIASYIAYNEAKRCAKPGEKFGEGELKGIAAPESANNGATAATLIPLLTLGLPGGGGHAVGRIHHAWAGGWSEAVFHFGAGRLRHFDRMRDFSDCDVFTGKISASPVRKNHTHSAGASDGAPGRNLLYGSIFTDEFFF